MKSFSNLSFMKLTKTQIHLEPLDKIVLVIDGISRKLKQMNEKLTAIFFSS